ncbi:hypothetical protein ABMA28_011533 [Loxostege sticticalis]|uniref:Uncharacterized protein n=1 Tax=Loxostege sticticalis TaxID=481309 RepID=A0ABD0S7P4_LOXSC
MSRFSRMLRRSTNNDESIYETLEELRNADRTPPVPPIETIPTLKQKQKPQNPEGTSKSLPRREKARPPPNLPATLHRIPAERQRSPDLDISKRPPLPLPTEVPEERSATPSRIQRTPFSPIEEDEHSTTHTLIRPTRPGIGQSSVASELDNVFKMRKASLAPQTAKNIPPAPPKKHSFPNLRGKPNKVTSDLDDSADHGKFVPDTPNPLPTGKSAVLLGLTPGPAPKTNTNAVKSPPKPLPNSSVKPVPTPGPPLKPSVTSKTPKTPASVPVGSKPVKPPPGSVMLPRPPTNMAATKAPVMPSKPASAVKLPKPSMTADKPAGLRPVPQNIRPDKPMTTPNTPRPVPKLPTPSVRKPPPLPPPQEPIQEAVYAESEEPLYDEEWTPPNPQLQKFEKPTPQLPMASIGKPPPLPPPNRPTEEDEYEEFAEEPLYNSDDEEWVYEPLQKYNIYSS